MARRTTHKQAARRAAIFISTVAIGLAGVWALPRVSSAAAGWASAPPVREKTVKLGGGLAVATAKAADGAAGLRSTAGETAAVPAPPPGRGRVVEPGFRFDMVGLLCDEPLPDGSVLTVVLRTSSDGRAWGPWIPVDLEVRTAGGDGESSADDGPDEGVEDGPAAFTEPVWVGSARYLEVKAGAAPGRGNAPARLDGVRLMFLNTSGDATVVDRLASTARATVAAIAGIGATPIAAAMTDKPAIVTRAQWGADESLRGHAPEYAPVKMAFVHHTVNANSYSRAQAPGLVRGIYYYDVKGLKWSDLGYNFLVDRYGTVYEGRYGGVTRGVIGAQVLGFNTSSTGIAMIGTFVSVSPPEAMMSALKRLLAWKLDVHHVDPQATARLECRETRKFTEGQIVPFPVIAGHRQANWTACPGDALYRLLPGVRTTVGGMGLPKIYDYVVGTINVSPNGDGVQEGTRIRFRTSEPADWTVLVAGAGGTLRRSFSGRGDTVDLRWDGRDAAGAVVPDGAYSVVARARAGGAEARAAAATVVVDTVPPTATEIGVVPGVFSPNSDDYADRCKVRFATPETCASRVVVVDAAGAVLGTVAGWTTAPAGERSASWDGRLSASGTPADATEGAARLRVETKDAAGNAAARTATARIDRTLGFLRPRPQTISPNGDRVQDRASIGFKLTRPATVVLAVTRDGATVRALGRAAYAAGSQAVVWDGLLDDGSRAANGAYRLKATATSSLGSVDAGRWITVDRYRPRLSAPAGVTVQLGRRARIVFAVSDPFSADVRVTATVRDLSGKTIAVIDGGWVPSGAPAEVLWKPPTRRTYTVTLTAVDRGGNPEYAASRTRITVK